MSAGFSMMQQQQPMEQTAGFNNISAHLNKNTQPLKAAVAATVNATQPVRYVCIHNVAILIRSFQSLNDAKLWKVALSGKI